MEFILLISSLICLGIGFIIGQKLSKLKFESNFFPKSEYEKIKLELSGLQSKVSFYETNLNQFKELNEKQRKEVLEYSSQSSAKNAIIQNLNEKLITQKNEIEQLHKKLTQEFENIANKILKSNSDELNKEAGVRLESILKPLNENLNKFEKKIEESRESQVRENSSLKEQIILLTSLNQEMTKEAKNLTNALKGESKTRGNWGEMVLENILINSGLIPNEHYTLQKGLKNEEGSILKPDAIIKLPDDKHVIIDSKLSLIDYEKYVNSENLDERELSLKNHIASIKRHISDLSKKNYQNLMGVNSPDFVLMFVPIESAFSLVAQFDISIYHEAIQKNIFIVTPFTLVAALKIIHSLWRLESQNHNSKEIALIGAKLFDKLANFIEELKLVGVNINKTQESYEKTLKRLETGNDNVLKIAGKMKELGVKTNKEIPLTLVE